MHVDSHAVNLVSIVIPNKGLTALPATLKFMLQDATFKKYNMLIFNLLKLYFLYC